MKRVQDPSRYLGEMNREGSVKSALERKLYAKRERMRENPAALINIQRDSARQARNTAPRLQQNCS